MQGGEDCVRFLRGYYPDQVLRVFLSWAHSQHPYANSISNSYMDKVKYFVDLYIFNFVLNLLSSEEKVEDENEIN